jgi:hypothetical protein
MFSVVTPRIWVSPRSNSAEPWTRVSATSAEAPDVGDPRPSIQPCHAQPAREQLLGQSAEGTPDLFPALELRSDLFD